MALDERKEYRERLGAALDFETAYQVAEEVIALEERDGQAHPERLSARVDYEGARYVSWYRRHRNKHTRLEDAPDCE